MKNLKRTLSMLLASTMLIGLVSCGAKNEASDMGVDGEAIKGAFAAENAQVASAGNKANANYYTSVAMEVEEASIMATVPTTADDAYTTTAATIKMPEEVISYEDYGKLIENPFIKTAETAVSTFSADVDTASYTYFRKLVSYNWKINEIAKQAGSSLRTEEMINYFDYDYVDPKDGELFGVRAQMAQCPWNEQATLLQLGLKADDAVNTSGNNLVFLIDVSGSMSSSDKLPLLKNAFTFLTETLTSNDTVSIVTYSGKESVALEGCKGTYTDKILNAVNSLNASGSTNGQAGLQKAYEIAKKYYIEGGNNRIIMASDGDLNVGISSPDQLKNFISEKRDEGIYLSVLGFGTGNYRDANMEALADNGNGVYYYIDGTSEAEKVFGTDLLATLYTVAEDVKMQITFDPQYVAQYRLVGYENRLLNEEDFEDDTKDAGEVGAGHTLTVCYELILTEEGKKLSADTDLMKLAIRHKAPGEDISQLSEYTIDGTSYTTSPDADFQFVCAVTQLAMILHESEYAENISAADVLATLNALPLSGDPYKTEFRDMVKKLAN